MHEAQSVLSHHILRSVSTVCEIRMPPGPAVHGTKAEDGTIRWSHVDCTMRSLVEETSKRLLATISRTFSQSPVFLAVSLLLILVLCHRLGRSGTVLVL